MTSDGDLCLFKHTKAEREIYRDLCSFTFVHQLICVPKYQLGDFLYISNENIAVHKFWWKISPTGELESL